MTNRIIGEIIGPTDGRWIVKTSVKTPETGQLVPQAHGGALRRGGTNRGGPGRPPSAIREQLRGSFEQRIRVLEDIADGKEYSAADRLRAVDLLGKFGLGQRDAISAKHQVSGVVSHVHVWRFGTREVTF